MQIKIEELLRLPVFLDGSDGSMWTETDRLTFACLRRHPYGETAHRRYLRVADVVALLRDAGVLSEIDNNKPTKPTP